MDVMEAIRERHVYRRFKGDAVSRESLNALIEAAAMAPSAWNAQPWRFYVSVGERRDRATQVLAQTTRHLQEYVDVLSPEEIELAAEFYTTLGHAPVATAVTVPMTDDRPTSINNLLSCGCALENLALAATDMSLGTCYLTPAEWLHEELADVFQVPAGETIVTIVLVGWPDEEPQAPEHRMDVATFLE